MECKKYIWYASYGSNMLKERFMAYIKGGNYEGREYKGCDDKTLPTDDRSVIIPYELYFANKSKTWNNCGVAFIDSESKDSTLGRMYLITEDQYEQLRDQEGRIWYDKEIKLGECDGLPIKTFTHGTRFEENKPALRYLDIIQRGIRETYPELKLVGMGERGFSTGIISCDERKMIPFEIEVNYTDDSRLKEVEVLRKQYPTADGKKIISDVLFNSSWKCR